ncbi:MAG: polyprenyl synthetase family protein, partial [Solirubrobacteraceae bacterium]
MAGAEATLAKIVAAAGEHVPRLLGVVEQRLVALAAGHGPVLAEHAGDTIAAGGKRLRPLLVLLAAGPRAIARPQLIAAAAAVELIHSATLVHDDVLDGAHLRRGVPTVWARGGRALAVATGDLLFSRAFSELAAAGSLRSVQALSRATSALAEGELLQRQDAWNAAVPVERYLQRCELKTARLFEAACELGALAAESDPGDVEVLGAFGRGIGLAFQLLDDVIDVAGPASVTGKHRGTDLLDGTVTLPLIIARERAAELAEFDLRGLRGAGADRVEELCDRIAATGALG